MAIAEKSSSAPYVYGFPTHRYDVAGKYFPVGVGMDGSTFNILDVGGFVNNPVLTKLYPGLKIVSLNLPGEYHGRTGDITYDGTKMPFTASSIPVVMAVDVLEHVIAQERLSLLAEMSRVAERSVIASGPFSSADNNQYEQFLLKRMEEAGIPPKHSILQHQEYGLPTLENLVRMARELRKPFDIYPATVTALDFHGLLAQVDLIREDPAGGSQRTELIAQTIDSELGDSPKPTWEQAYRAVLVIDKIPKGRIVGTDELFLSSDEKTAYQAALSHACFGIIEDPISFYYRNPLRGRHIVIEGPEGSGKTTIVKLLAMLLETKGYTVAIPTNHGLRQDIRDIEKHRQKLLPEPSRGLYFAHAMQESIVAGNAHTLRGPCYISISERGLASVPMHHEMYCKGDPTIPLLLHKHLPHALPDLTIILGVNDIELNWEMMRRGRDLANMERTIDQLRFQREYYRSLQNGALTGTIFRIDNPGKEGTLNQVVEKILWAIENYCDAPIIR